MEGINPDRPNQENGYRLRYQESLIWQIEKDYAGLNRLWEKLQKGTISLSEKKELSRTIAWLRKELTTYKKLSNMGIEGLTCVKIKEIENDLKNKETKLNIISTSGGDLRPTGPGLKALGRNEGNNGR